MVKIGRMKENTFFTNTMVNYTNLKKLKIRFSRITLGNYVFGTVRLIDIFETEFVTAQQYVKDETPIEFVEFKNGK